MFEEAILKMDNGQESWWADICGEYSWSQNRQGASFYRRQGGKKILQEMQGWGGSKLVESIQGELGARVLEILSLEWILRHPREIYLFVDDEH